MLSPSLIQLNFYVFKNNALYINIKHFFKGEYEAANRQIEGLSTEKANLSEKVAIAAQLDAIGINLSLLDKRGKATKRLKKAKTLQVDFSIA